MRKISYQAFFPLILVCKLFLNILLLLNAIKVIVILISTLFESSEVYNLITTIA